MHYRTHWSTLICIMSFIISHGEEWNILDQGIVATKSDISTCNENTRILNETFPKLQAGDTLLVPNGEFWFNGGIYASDLQDITIQIEGSINFQNNRTLWPDKTHNLPRTKEVAEAIVFENCDGITLTSNNTDKGLINGNANLLNWWNAFNYIFYKENRPRLLHIYNSANIKIENIFFKNSPYWHVYLDDVINVEISHSNVSANAFDESENSIQNIITAFNTDGFDIAGKNVWIHDVEIFNADDCITVKSQTGASLRSSCSENMLFENIKASGLGLTIGSIPPSIHHACVRNITFRDATMINTFKGIYLKSAPGSGTGSISDILYDNIEIVRPTGFPIWIGPQQAIYGRQCSLLWPIVDTAKCPVTEGIIWENIYLRDIEVDSAHGPGVILGNIQVPMRSIEFENVYQTNLSDGPWGQDYYCDGAVAFTSINGTSPIPGCNVVRKIIPEYDIAKNFYLEFSKIYNCSEQYNETNDSVQLEKCLGIIEDASFKIRVAEAMFIVMSMLFSII